MKLYNTRPLAEACAGVLKQALGPGIPVRVGEPKALHHDFGLHIGTKPQLNLVVEAKARIATRNQALHSILQLRALVGEAIIFAEWIPALVADEFRKAGIFFVDAQGNAFIRKPPQIVLDIRGKKPERPPRAEPGRLIEPAGLKIVHYLLTHPQVAGDPLRVIAGGAGVALGTAHAVMKELQRGQWLLPAPGDKRRFGDLKGLIELFVRGYALKLRPVCLLGSFRHKTRAPLELLDGVARRLAGMDGHWGVTGGMAARRLTRHLEPDSVTLFIDDQARVKLENEPMLRDDANGNLTLLKLFGPAILSDMPRPPWPLASPLLIYAELLEAGGARELETAQLIQKRFLGPEIAHGK